MSESKPKSGPSESIKHNQGSTTFKEVKQTPNHVRTQERTYTPTPTPNKKK